MGFVAGAMRGALAGVVATAAMDLVWYRRYRSGGGDADVVEWEFSTSTSGFGEDAPAPARVGKLIADTVGIDLPDSSAGVTNNVVHWVTGIGWGKVGGVLATVTPLPAIVAGLATGVTAWGTSYALLGQLGIYQPISEYDTETLRKDFTAHLVFGATLGLALTAASRARSR